jgi:hypothetical protein
MRTSGLSQCLLALAIAILAFAAPARAQATRTWVSGVGDDVNPCSRTAPCKTFAGAISKTAASGEINVLDPGGFGAVTITKAITIRSDHIEAGVLGAGTNGIVVAAGANDRVVLEGLDIDGDATGLNGVSITSGLRVYILRCAIRRFTQNGVNIASTTPMRVLIQDSIINFNNGGVNLPGTGVLNASVIVNSTVSGNTVFAFQANTSNGRVNVVNSVIDDDPASLNLTNGGLAASFGPSNLVDGSGMFTFTNPFQ